MKDIIAQLIELQHKPEPFTRGDPLFWDDPHISSQMLQFHLNPNIEAASRRPETIDRAVVGLIDTLSLKEGDSVLDMGCGPGLYASRLARAGLQVTGVDYSRRSIAYATMQPRISSPSPSDAGEMLNGQRMPSEKASPILKVRLSRSG